MPTGISQHECKSIIAAQSGGSYVVIRAQEKSLQISRTTTDSEVNLEDGGFSIAVKDRIVRTYFALIGIGE